MLRTGSRNTYSLAAPRFVRRRFTDNPFDIVVEDLNKVPLFTPHWLPSPLVLLVHHLFGATAFQEAALPFALATWLLERPLARAYRGVPVEAVSESTKQDLVGRGFPADSIVVIPNGVDLSSFSPDPAGSRFAEPTLLYLGRLKRYKRADLILDALARLISSGSAARLLIAGRGDAESHLRRRVAELELGDRVRFLGFVDEDEKLRLLRKAWVHVFTSPKEGWGITNLEAAACGTPTVASDSPGLRDSVVHGRTGLLVPHGDTDALADTLHLMLERSELRRQLGEGARAFALEHGWDASADRTEAHLGEVLDRAGGPVWTRDRPADF